MLVNYTSQDLQKQTELASTLKNDIKFIGINYSLDEGRDLMILEFKSMINQEKKLLKTMQNQLKQTV